MPVDLPADIIRSGAPVEEIHHQVTHEHTFQGWTEPLISCIMTDWHRLSSGLEKEGAKIEDEAEQQFSTMQKK